MEKMGKERKIKNEIKVGSKEMTSFKEVRERGEEISAVNKEGVTDRYGKKEHGNTSTFISK